jgi:hypothetical protein
MKRDRLEGEDWAGEVSGDRYGVFLFLVLVLGVSTQFSTMASAKFTVLRGVTLEDAFLLRLSAARVMSCNWRPEAPRVAEDDPWVELRGVKKRVNRLGVIGGAFLGFRVPMDENVGGGDEGGSSGNGSRRPLRPMNGDDILCYRCRSVSNAQSKFKGTGDGEVR